MTAADGTPLWANAAFLKLSGAGDDRDLHSIERLFSGQPGRRGGGPSPRRRRRARAPGDRGNPHAGRHRRHGRAAPAGTACGSARRAATRRASAGSIGDITREREHQENIFQELQNAIDYLDHAPAGFFSLEPDGRIRYLNATLAEWIGIDLAEFEPGAAHIRDIVTVEGFSVIQARQPEPARGEALDIDLVRTDGTRLPVRLLHRVPVAPDGTVGASRTLVLDMRAATTARRAASRKCASRASSTTRRWRSLPSIARGGSR